MEQIKEAVYLINDERYPFRLWSRVYMWFIVFLIKVKTNCTSNNSNY